MIGVAWARTFATVNDRLARDTWLELFDLKGLGGGSRLTSYATETNKTLAILPPPD